MTKIELKLMRATLESYAENIQRLPDDLGDKEELYGELFTMLDDAGAVINQILGEVE